MKKKTLIAALAALAAVAAAHAQGLAVSPSNPCIQYTGRVNFSNPESPLMVYPGTQVAISFTGTSLKMKAKPGSGYFNVEIDNLPVTKVQVAPGDSVVTLATGLSTRQTHTARIYLAYEGYVYRPELRGFILDDSATVVAPPARPKRKIEFIGNSMTCAFGSEAADRHCHFDYATENHYLSYSSLLCRMLDAEEMCVARSGIGAYRNYNGPAAGSKDNMNYWYDYTCYGDTTQRWDFSLFRPDIICVNLGTNDLSTTGYRVDLYKQAYRKLIVHLHQVQPQAKIVMLAGGMLTGKALAQEIATLDALQQEFKAQGLPTYRFTFSPYDGRYDYGAAMHPSRRQHELMAGELLPFLARLLAGGRAK